MSALNFFFVASFNERVKSNDAGAAASDCCSDCSGIAAAAAATCLLIHARSVKSGTRIKPRH